MGWLSVDEVRVWCNENDDAETMATLTAITAAVQTKIANHLDRPVVADSSELEAKPEGVVADDCIKLAAKLLASHYNENREVVTDAKAAGLPFGFDFLLTEYRRRTSF